ncbi:MAG: Undecaprenyl-phosphate galactosephosphotransferase [Frankiales bacterium]|nr:Undecaprenyl-phosphate galactosephosphotransferase [Frankiales bacterium]
MFTSGLEAASGGEFGEMNGSLSARIVTPPSLALSQNVSDGLMNSDVVTGELDVAVAERAHFDSTSVAGKELPLLTTGRGRRAGNKSTTRRSTWLRQYQTGLVLIDALAASLAVMVSFVARFGMTHYSVGLDSLMIVALPLVWVALVALNRAYEGRFVGVGATEFQRIFTAFLHLTALLSFASFVTKAELARGFVLLALPLALVFDLLARFAARKWLHNQRASGRAMTSVLVVGEADAIADFTTLLRRDRYAGMRVVGACVPSEFVVDSHTVHVLDQLDVPLLGDVDSVLSAVNLSGTDTVAVVSSGLIGPEKLRWISWQLEGNDTDLVVSPGLTEVAGPRLHIQPVAGLPLLHVEEPEFSGFRRILKSAFDRTVAAAALFIFSPVVLALVVAVRMDSKGPAFFRQQRVGRNGEAFTMLKFRSMHVDAEDHLTALVGENQHGEGVLFKMRNDPRITKVGALLRKFSLDELPQLINVVRGSMSLVGPRPPLPREVARYEDHVHRRLLVKPGLTGLWQISGRSDLAWDESVRLDLRYVENWSIAGDLLILWKTVFTVVKGTGAY